MIGLSPNALLPTATIPKTSSSRLPSAARVTKATLSITHGSRSRRHKPSYNDKATLNNLVRISELHQKQSHWTIENDLCGKPEKLAPVGGFIGDWSCARQHFKHPWSESLRPRVSYGCVFSLQGQRSRACRAEYQYRQPRHHPRS